jgi:hypothetical protein
MRLQGKTEYPTDAPLARGDKISFQLKQNCNKSSSEFTQYKLKSGYKEIEQVRHKTVYSIIAESR